MQLLLEFFEFGLEGLHPKDLVGPRDFVEGLTDVRERWNHVSVVVAEPEEGGESGTFLWFRPLSDFVELGQVGVNTVPSHDSAEVVNSLSEK